MIRQQRDYRFAPIALLTSAFVFGALNAAGQQSAPAEPSNFPATNLHATLAPGADATASRQPFSLGSSSSPSRWDHLRDADRIGSTNVPMDSWVYPALERLAGMGWITSQNLAIRPWTRAECLRQIHEAEQNISGNPSHDSAGAEAEVMLNDLDHEFEAPQNSSQAVLESSYVRYGVIGGPALTDGFHFGQTWWNDFGRPLGRGSSVIAGFSARATHGRFFLFDRQELQQSPGNPAITQALHNDFFQLDIVPGDAQVPLANAYPVTPAGAAYLRQRPLELYAGVSFAGNNLSFGKQEIYWGPNTMGPLAFSSNAEPTYNLRLLTTRPHLLPFLPELGTYRYDIVFGKLSGHKYPARPYFNGQKISFDFKDTLEVSFTRWSVLWGVGHPMTLRSLGRNFFSSASTGAATAMSNFPYGDRTDPGDRKSDFDFTLHVPGLRKFLTLYTDAYADDETNPIDAPRRVVWSPGVYLSRLPYLPHVDLRVEMASSEELSQDEGGSRFFINSQYLDSNTNKGFLLGNAVGRDARALQGKMTYWKSDRTSFTTSYRQTKGGNFLPGGSTISDASVNANFAWSREWSAQIFIQYERFLIPYLMPGAQRNGSGWIQITWNPALNLKIHPSR